MGRAKAATRSGSRPPAKPRPPNTRSRWLGAALCVAASFVLYANALSNPYVSDDKKIVSENPGLHNPSWRGLRTIWTRDYWVLLDERGDPMPFGPDRFLYRPLTTTTFVLNEILYQQIARVFAPDLLAQVNAPPETAARASVRLDEIRRECFRSVNVLLHGLAAFMVGLWCARWVGRTGGVAGALVVLVHPVATDVINRLVGRADLDVLLGVAGFLAVQRLAQDRGWTWRRAVLGAVWVAVAMLSKEAGAIVIPLAAAQEWIGRGQRARIGNVWPAATAVAVPVAVYAVARSMVVEAPHYGPDPTWDLLMNPAVGQPMAARVPVFFALAWHYMRTLVYPWPLIAFDVPARIHNWTDVGPYVGIIVIVVMTAIGVWAIVHRHLLAIAMVWCSCSLLIVGQLLMPIGTYVDIRLVYTMLGALALAVGWAASLLKTAPVHVRWSAAAVSLGIASVAAVVVVQRNVEHRTDLSLLQADLHWRPTSPATTLRLGDAYLDVGDFEHAGYYLDLTTTYAPNSSQAWYDLGTYYARRQDYVTARDDFQKSIACNPSNYLAWLNGSTAALSLGDTDAAWTMLTAAAALQPGDSTIEYNMAIVELVRGDTEGALRRLDALEQREPTNDAAKRLIQRIENQSNPPPPQ